MKRSSPPIRIEIARRSAASPSRIRFADTPRWQRACTSSSVRSPTRAQDVVGAVGVHRLRALGQALEVGLDLGERLGVDQVAQLLLSEELSQQLAIK